MSALKAYINLYDKDGRSIGMIELEPRIVDELPQQGTRKGELVFNLKDSSLYYWDGSAWKAPAGGTLSTLVIDTDKDWGGHIIKNLGEPVDAGDAARKGDLTWDNISNKPTTFPPESHTHPRSDITDFFDSPFWDNIPDKPVVVTSDSAKKIFVSSTEPTAENINDVWIEI